ncbi:MAG: hypothetical protein KJP03_00895 [Gammaproteobacteria bacterium]|nr:hypothetical protein [Gammaproteobacteria bacterium]
MQYAGQINVSAASFASFARLPEKFTARIAVSTLHPSIQADPDWHGYCSISLAATINQKGAEKARDAGHEPDETDPDDASK